MSTPVSLRGIQYLRAIAALMVAYLHMVGQREEYQPFLMQYLGGGAQFGAGVDVFFVISGFIMMVTGSNCTPRQFIVKRLIRIIPLYWILTLSVVVAAVLSPEMFKRTTLGIGAVVKSLLFIPFVNPDHGGEVVPLLVPGWSLNFEIFFYIVFSAALLVRPARRLLWTGLFFSAFVALFAALPDAAEHPIVKFFASQRLFEFWLGMLIGRLHLSGRPMLPWAGWWLILLAGAMTLMFGFPGMDGIRQSAYVTVFSAAAIVFGMVGLERVGGVGDSRALRFLGDASYSIYLSHIFALGAARAIWADLYHAAPSLPGAAEFAVFSMLLVVVAAAATYLRLEKPMQRGLQRLTKSRATALAT